MLLSFVLIFPSLLLSVSSQRGNGNGLTKNDFETGRSLKRPKAPPKDPTSTKSSLFEGDINLAGKSVRQVAGSLSAPPKKIYGAARNAARDKSRRWPNARVPYVISSQFKSWERGVIANAIGVYHSKTCVRFVPKTSSDRDYIYFTKDDGCYSEVGRGGGRQVVSLDNGCVYEGIIQHELMHVMGFFHEQSRTDRDKYVSVKWNNIMPGMDSQFTKFSSNVITNLGFKYDYGSIMHYSRTSFSRNGKDTIIPKRSGARIGQRDRLSSTDVAKINKIANCGGSRSNPSTSSGRRRSSSTAIGRVCKDNNKNCRGWKKKGYCTKRSLKSFMQKNCCASC